MTPVEVGRAVELICRGKGKPVALYVRRMPGRTDAEVTALVPVGRANGVLAGRYTPGDITIAELRQDLDAAQSELTKGRAA